jgi:hypothetical protein
MNAVGVGNGRFQGVPSELDADHRPSRRFGRVLKLTINEFHGGCDSIEVVIVELHNACGENDPVRRPGIEIESDIRIGDRKGDNSHRSSA